MPKQVVEIMPKQVVEYKCLLMSPSDVSEEREALTSLVASWNAQVGRGLDARVELARWESHAVPDMSMPAQEAINRQLLEDCDFGIAIFWSKLGTATAKHPSGSVEEIFELLQKGARVLVYFCNRPIPQAALRDDQFTKLQETKASFIKQGLLAEYSDIASLRDQVQLHITNIVSQLLAKDRGATTFLPSSGTVTAPTPDLRVTANPGFLRDYNQYSGNVVKTLTATAQNHSSVIVYLHNISLELKDGRLLTIMQDFVTGEFQKEVVLNPGQSHSFHFQLESLRKEAPDIVCAVATDAIGRMYRSDSKSLPVTLQALLKSE